MEYGPHKESVVRIGEQEYALRDVGFAPLRTIQLVELLHFAKGITGFAPYTTKLENRAELCSAALNFAETKSNRSCELCSDSVTHEIASMSPWIYDIEGGKAEFSNYDAFEGMRFPRHLELRINKVSVVSITITKLQEQTHYVFASYVSRRVFNDTKIVGSKLALFDPTKHVKLTVGMAHSYQERGAAWIPFPRSKALRYHLSRGEQRV